MPKVYAYSLYQKYLARWPRMDREILLMQCHIAACRINRRRQDDPYTVRSTSKIINRRSRDCRILTFTGATEDEYNTFLAARFNWDWNTDLSGWIDGKTVEIDGRLFKSCFRVVL